MVFSVKPIGQRLLSSLALCLILATVAASTIAQPVFAGTVGGGQLADGALDSCAWAEDLPHTWLTDIDTYLRGAGATMDWGATDRTYYAFFINATGDTNYGNNANYKGKTLVITWKTTAQASTLDMVLGTGSGGSTNASTNGMDTIKQKNGTGAAVNQGRLIKFDSQNRPYTSTVFSWPNNSLYAPQTAFAASSDCLTVLSGLNDSLVLGTKPRPEVFTDFPKFTAINWVGVFNGQTYQPPVEVPSNGTVTVEGGADIDELKQLAHDYGTKGLALVLAAFVAFWCIWALRWVAR